MLKKSLLILFILCFFQSVYAQTEIDSLLQFNQNRLQITKGGMITLGTWALGNIATNAILIRNAEGVNKRFYEMNIYWNLVNLGLAGFGYFSANGSDAGSFSHFSSLQEHHSLGKILLLNAGLDIGYMATGLYLRERSKNTNKRQDLLEGYGKSLMLQGGFLLLFDTTLYFVQQANLSKFTSFFENLSISSNGLGLVILF